MARKRAYRKRADYTKGGRVHAEEGFHFNDVTRMAKGLYDRSKNYASLATGQDRSMWDGRAPVTEGKADWVNPSPNLTDTTRHTANTAAMQQGDAYTGDINKTQAQIDAEKAAQIQSNVNWANQRGAQTDAIHWSSPSNVSQAQQAAMFGGGGDLYDPATGRPYTPEQVNQRLGLDAQGNPLADTTTDTITPVPDYDEYQTGGPGKGISEAPPSVAAIPADGDYTEAETQAVQDAIASGAVTAAEVAAKFGVTEDQVTQEIKRREAVQSGVDIDNQFTTMEVKPPGWKPPYYDPYQATPVLDPDTGKAKVDPDTGEVVRTPYEFRDMDAEAAAQAKTTAAVEDIPVDADYTQFEVDQVYDALESGAMTVEQVAAQFGATPAQVQAEWDRMKQQKAGETDPGEDPLAE